MPYMSFARVYRPQTFDEIVGQEHVTTTLKNAIKMDKVAHAYLFAGPRGVGKTSAARILAKSLNCEKGPSSLPCGKCPPCKEISQGISMDVIEIDGASNRGIDEIRNLRENIKFASVGGKFRIYIIDEVHMLTPEAFNALLKTLEEPPLHVKFIFATTRPYKVLPTIISRCQRFDFRKIPVQDIAKKLEEIRKKEKLDVNDGAIFVIARQADGSMRDAEIILDQLLSFAKGKVTAEDVAKVLGLLEQDALFGIANAVINNEKEKVLSLTDELINGGKDPIFIASSIINHFRNLMVAKIAKDTSKSYITLSEDDYHKLEEQARPLSLDEILYATYTLSAAMDLMKKTSLSRVPLEIALIKLTQRNRPASIKKILEKLSAIESSFAKGEIQTGYPSEDRREKNIETPLEPSLNRAEPPAIPEEEVAAERDILLLGKIKNSWAKVLNFIKNKKMSVATFLSAGRLIKVEDNVLAIGFNKNNSLHKEALEVNTNRKFVEDAIKSIVGESVSLSIEELEGEAKEAALPVLTDIEEVDRPHPKRIDPIVESALNIFEGKVVDVRDNKPKGKA
jgi:DNA polymerase-3 subunit gamma/tau